jgi:hypothetical protein
VNLLEPILKEVHGVTAAVQLAVAHIAAATLVKRCEASAQGVIL